ncbi:MAG: hypothetical protein FWE17_02340 [Alphaproteobacteria bacterium]|nr:hypothetical protein [Alphaproteobacteria bacterium]MCL2758285.1 hypothetical protein [Alphaproteobacteria bacterium]
MLDINKTLNFYFSSDDEEMLDTFLPPRDESKGDAGAHQMGRLVHEIIYDDAPPELYYSIMEMAQKSIDFEAKHSSENGVTCPQTRFGYRLGYFMSFFPGANKVAQLAHSLPATPPEWTDGLAYSKSEANPPSKQKMLEWAMKELPTALFDGITIDDHKGTGSYLTTWGINFANKYPRKHPEYRRFGGHSLVLSVRRPKAKESAFHFIDFLIKTAEKLSETSKDAQKCIQPLMELAIQARKIIDIETDLGHSVKQAKIAAQLYDPIKVNVGSMTASYYTQGAAETGPGYRIARCVYGTHFNRLPTVSPSDRERKRLAAVAIVATELHIILSGKPFDHDRHGDNEGISFNGNNLEIGIFDTGAQMLSAPTTEQKKVFADCIVNALVNSARNKYGPLSSLKHTIGQKSQELKDRPEDLDYINAVLRAAISLGDYIKHMRGNDWKQIGVALLKTGQIDPVISARVKKRLLQIARNKGKDKLKGMGILKLFANLVPEDARERAEEEIYYPRNPNPFAGNKKSSPKKTGQRYEKIPVAIHDYSLGKQGLLRHIVRIAAKTL